MRLKILRLLSGAEIRNLQQGKLFVLYLRFETSRRLFDGMPNQSGSFIYRGMAEQLNLPLSEYILRVLSIRQVLSNPPKTGAELVAYWQSEGIINSRPEITDSQVHARHLRHEAETRTRT